MMLRPLVIAGAFLAQAAYAAPGFERTPPRMPVEALRNCVSGAVVVRLTLGADGTVADARVVRASPPGLFDAATLEAVRAWRFDPAAHAPGAQLEQVVEFKFPAGTCTAIPKAGAG